MSSFPQSLLSEALRIKWEHGHAGNREAAWLLSERLPGYSAREYAEAGRRAAVLDGTAYELAADWFAGKGRQVMPTAEELECLCPGFAPADYAEAIRKNTLWARK
jgi:hypothetical protein